MAFIGGLLGVMAALGVTGLDRRSRARKSVAVAQRIRSAIATDLDILKQLPADSPAAARLEGVINLRLSAYLGRPPLRPARTAVSIAVLAGAAVWMGMELSSAVETADFAVYGAGTGFFGAMLLLCAGSTLRVMQRYRRAAAGNATSVDDTDPTTSPSQPGLVPE